MNNRELEILIRMVAESEALSDEPLAPSSRTSECVSMRRLSAVSAGAGSLSTAESAHANACPLCSARLAAFENSTVGTQATGGDRYAYAPGAPVRRHRISPHSPGVSAWLLRVAPLAAAACLLYLLRVPPLMPDGARNANPPTGPAVNASAIPVRIAYTPGTAEPHGARVDCFQPTAPEPCVAMAVFRTWNSACDCLVWELHRWENGETLTEIAPGQSVDVVLNVSDDPPVEQYLVVAVARGPNQLPERGDETTALLNCLNTHVPPAGVGDDASTFSSAMAGCLPPGVTVVPASFVVK